MSMKEIVVVAVGGNALGPSLIYEEDTCASLAHVIESLTSLNKRVLVVHGNGPHVGTLLSLQPEVPLNVIVAQTQAIIGHIIFQCVPCCVVVTHVHVEWKQDLPLIKPIGVDKKRRVASPDPVAVAEVDAIRALVEENEVTVAGGGGGIPLDLLSGAPVDCVVDKDLTAGLLAASLGASVLLILTDVDGVYRDWGKPGQQMMPEISCDALEVMLPELQLGSMEPKARAALSFVRSTKRPAFIGHLADAERILQGGCGTRVVL